jgi:toxin FitB
VSFLLDTNVLSEAVKPAANVGVVQWLSNLPPASAYLSVLTLGEIGRGVALLPESRRKDDLRRWLDDDLPERFRGRVLPISAGVASVWGELDGEARRAGRPLPTIDGLLLATARANGLTFVTRNVSDCGGRGVPVFNPWDLDGA